MTQINPIRSIAISDWIALAREGAAPPVSIPLEGSSMQPLIRRSIDHVTIVPLYRPLKKGDVVLFTTSPGRYVVHRVWKLEEDRLQTLGDNCRNPDRWMPYDCVIGQAVSFRRNGRKITLDSRGARLWGRFWMAVFPVRILYYRARALAGKCCRKLFKS